MNILSAFLLFAYNDGRSTDDTIILLIFIAFKELFNLSTVIVYEYKLSTTAHTLLPHTLLKNMMCVSLCINFYSYTGIISEPLIT